MCECETQSQTARACPLADAFVISPLRSHPPCGRRARPLYREAGPDMHCGSGFLPRFFARIAARANSHRGRIRSHNLRNAVLLWERFPTAILRPNRRPRQFSSRKEPLPQLRSAVLLWERFPTAILPPALRRRVWSRSAATPATAPERGSDQRLYKLAQQDDVCC